MDLVWQMVVGEVLGGGVLLGSVFFCIVIGVVVGGGVLVSGRFFIDLFFNIVLYLIKVFSKVVVIICWFFLLIRKVLFLWLVRKFVFIKMFGMVVFFSIIKLVCFMFWFLCLVVVWKWCFICLVKRIFCFRKVF